MEKKRLFRTVLAIAGIAAAAGVVLSMLDSVWPGGEKVAVVRIEGVIVDSREAIEELRKFRDNPSVKAIVLRIDSPGGGVVASQEIHSEVLKTRADGRVKVVTSMGNLAASGGYYIAAATDRIVANPGTLTGSIGVIMELANVQGLLEKVGVQSIVIKSGAHKDLASPFRAMSVADGRVFTGRQAKTARLVDELGDLQDAIRLAGKMVGIAGEPRVVETHKRFSLRDVLGNVFDGKVSALIPTGINLKYMMTL